MAQNLAEAYNPEKLRPQQIHFATEVSLGALPSEAVIKAGYSAKSADAQAVALMKNPKVLAAIQRRKATLATKADISQVWVLQKLQEVAERCTQSVMVLDKKGEPTGEYRFDAAGANKALELLGKHLGMFVDRHEVSHTVTHTDARLEEYTPDQLRAVIQRIEAGQVTEAEYKELPAPPEPT